MFEYGCFVAFWGNFELLMEVAIWQLTRADPIENCRRINGLTAGQKRDQLRSLLETANQTKTVVALDKVFDIAERNNWIHGHILNPKGDFSHLTRLRVTTRGGSFAVNNTPISFDVSPFQEFYKAYGDFQTTSGVNTDLCNEYIRKLQGK